MLEFGSTERWPAKYSARKWEELHPGRISYSGHNFLANPWESEHCSPIESMSHSPRPPYARSPRPSPGPRPSASPRPSYTHSPRPSMDLRQSIELWFWSIMTVVGNTWRLFFPWFFSMSLEIYHSIVLDLHLVPGVLDPHCIFWLDHNKHTD